MLNSLAQMGSVPRPPCPVRALASPPNRVRRFVEQYDGLRPFQSAGSTGRRRAEESLLGWRAYFGITEVLSLFANWTSGCGDGYAAANGSNGGARDTASYASAARQCEKPGTSARVRTVRGESR